MLLKLFTEFIGTFIFLSVIILTGEAIPIGLSLAVMIYFGGRISGGNFNPAVSTMFFAKGDLDVVTFIGYVIAQILGGLLALFFYRAAYGSSKKIK